MLKKVCITMILIMSALLAGYASAQSFFSNPLNKTPSPKANPNVLSPAEFQAQTQRLQQQKNEALSNQLKDSLAKAQPIVPIPTPPSVSTHPEVSLPSDATHQEQSTVPQATAGNPSEPAPASKHAPAPAKQDNVYTGFQNQEQNSTSSPSGDSGWNIKY